MNTRNQRSPPLALKCDGLHDERAKDLAIVVSRALHHSKLCIGMPLLWLLLIQEVAIAGQHSCHPISGTSTGMLAVEIEAFYHALHSDAERPNSYTYIAAFVQTYVVHHIQQTKTGNVSSQLVKA